MEIDSPHTLLEMSMRLYALSGLTCVNVIKMILHHLVCITVIFQLAWTFPIVSATRTRI